MEYSIASTLRIPEVKLGILVQTTCKKSHETEKGAERAFRAVVKPPKPK
jgi:hypothetical protein